jgi:hypothetical protein
MSDETPVDERSKVAATALLIAAATLIVLAFVVGMTCGRDLGFREGQRFAPRDAREAVP